MAALARDVEIVEVGPDDVRFRGVIRLAASILAQDRYLTLDHPHARESHVLGAFRGQTCVGFLRFLVQVIGTDVTRPPVVRDGEPLTEGFVEAFGVDHATRRAGIGLGLQTRAISHCRSAGCYQMRSRSPVASVENYSLKIGAGYVLSPSEQNDSYYFVLKL